MEWKGRQEKRQAERDEERKIYMERSDGYVNFGLEHQFPFSHRENLRRKNSSCELT